MNARRLATLRSVVETFAPPDARLDRVTTLAAEAVDALSPARSAEFAQLLDVLLVPMLGPAALRRGTLHAFASSPVTKLRTGYASLKRLVHFLCYAESEPGSPNPTWSRMNYGGPRSDTAGIADVVLPLSQARDGERVTADVVVIGSGAGGGVAASAFARAGKRVVVLEAGPAFTAPTMSQREMALQTMYLDMGLTSSRDLGVAILAGGTLGGGTTVNWCTSFRLADRVAAEWESESGIGGLAAELQPHYAEIEGALGMVPTAHHNANNQAILDGCAALGIQGGAMPRNAPPDCGDGCGFCGFGCAYAKKRSTTRAYLPHVIEIGGAIYADARAVRIASKAGHATSVRVEQTVDGVTRAFEIAADLFVVAGGSLRTPGILARSGIASPVLGNRLFLHPVSAITALYEHPIRAWEGPMQSAYSDAYNYRTGNYGPKIETAPTHPGLGALAVPWISTAEHTSLMSQYDHAISMIAVTRDRDPGRISLDAENAIDYRVSPHDGENLMAGIVGMAEIAFAAGATKLLTLHNDPIVIERAGWNAKRRDRFEAEVTAKGYAPSRQIFFSAHQMGTAAMGADPRTSVVDPTGAVWGFDNLLVADASAFPQASGVNPMLTVMALSARTAALHGGDVRVRERDLAGV